MRVRLFNMTPCPTLSTEMCSKHPETFVLAIRSRLSNLGVLVPDRAGVVRFCLRMSRYIINGPRSSASIFVRLLNRNEADWYRFLSGLNSLKSERIAWTSIANPPSYRGVCGTDEPPWNAGFVDEVRSCWLPWSAYMGRTDSMLPKHSFQAVRETTLFICVYLADCVMGGSRKDRFNVEKWVKRKMKMSEECSSDGTDETNLIGIHDNRWLSLQFRLGCRHGWLEAQRRTSWSRAWRKVNRWFISPRRWMSDISLENSLANPSYSNEATVPVCRLSERIALLVARPLTCVSLGAGWKQNSEQWEKTIVIVSLVFVLHFDLILCVLSDGDRKIVFLFSVRLIAYGIRILVSHPDRNNVKGGGNGLLHEQKSPVLSTYLARWRRCDAAARALISCKDMDLGFLSNGWTKTDDERHRCLLVWIGLELDEMEWNEMFKEISYIFDWEKEAEEEKTHRLRHNTSGNTCTRSLSLHLF